MANGFGHEEHDSLLILDVVDDSSDQPYRTLFCPFRTLFGRQNETDAHTGKHARQDSVKSR